jgi:hypothetical protein
MKINTTKVWRFQKLPYLCSTHLKITVMANTMKEYYEERAKEHYPLQKATISNSDWNMFLSMDEINKLVKGVTTAGRHMSFYYNPEVKSHGFDSWHCGYTEDYIEMLKMMHNKGLTRKDWLKMYRAIHPAPIAQRELSNDSLYAKNYKNVK